MALREPLHVFALPPTVLEDLSIRPGPSRSLPDPQPAPTPQAPPSEADSNPEGATGALSCNLCLGVSFSDVNEQRNHFRSDWHRYNVKRRLNNSNAKPVTETEFATLVEGLEGSLSGSASSSDDDSQDDSDDAVSTLIQKHKKHNIRKNPQNKGAEDEDEDYGPKIPRSPIMWFQSSSVPNTQLGAYIAIFPSSDPYFDSNEDNIRSLQELQDGGEHGRRWALFMVAGGHFAGMIARVSKPGRSSTTSDVPEPVPTAKKGKGKANHAVPDLEILAHKTFHRYTTRRKQGGSQSVNDNAKGPAKSAGAQLRRYGEQALREDIQALLLEWKDELEECEKIFIRASVSNRRIFMDFDESPMPKGDARIRTFPFQTRRPTLAELSRCLHELTRVKITHLTEEELRAADEAFLALYQKRKPVAPPQPTAPAPREKKEREQLSPEELAVRERWQKILEMVRKGRLESIQTLWTNLTAMEAKGERPLGPVSIPDDSTASIPPLVDTRIPVGVREEDGIGAGATILHVASAAGHETVISWLLEQRADPTIPLPSSSSSSQSTTTFNDADDQDDSIAQSRAPGGQKRAYDLAPTRAARNIFRRAAHAHPDWFDWLGSGAGGAGVPSVLTPEMEEAEARKKGVRRKGLKDRMKERADAQAASTASAQTQAQMQADIEIKRLERERAERDATRKGPQKVGGPMAGLIKQNQANLDAMSPEMRAKVERERRARAAEARLKALGEGK
ncbi:hypothetical protein DL93DRAFT_2140889 [Clavulina sp. PMI_390]|nr:hypothetical protein DL93DRAFT_2140889 [Clavulina sp. PMI_390]